MILIIILAQKGNPYYRYFKTVSETAPQIPYILCHELSLGSTGMMILSDTLEKGVFLPFYGFS